MATITHPAHTQSAYNRELRGSNIFSRFFGWAAAQDEQYHIAWVGISVMVMTAIFFPLSMTLILSNGASFPLIMTAVGSLALVVIANLASLPTRYTIPLFLLGILIDLTVVIISFWVS